MPRKWVLLLVAFVIEMGAMGVLWASCEPLRSGGPATVSLAAALCFLNGGYLFPLIHRRSRQAWPDAEDPPAPDRARPL